MPINKTININPELLKVSTKTNGKTRKKQAKQKPDISNVKPNTLKRNLLKRLKKHSSRDHKESHKKKESKNNDTDFSTEFEKGIEEHLITSYKRIRGSVRNGLAIVSVERGASGGSYFSIPPQIQLEIASRNKIITDEHSGRILVDSELAKEEETKIQKLIGK